jgi:AraC-like DNA-binding protein/mannose-6-phosphate isomerase-like protein (cupin superfamily)
MLHVPVGPARQMSHNEPKWIDTVNTPARQILDLRLIGMKHALALGKFHYLHASAPLAEQCHERWLVLQFVLSGQQKLVVDGRETMIRGGEMIRILPGQRYGTGSWPEQKGSMAWIILNLQPLPRVTALGMRPESIREIYALLTDPSAPMVGPMPKNAPFIIESAFQWWHRRYEKLARETIRNLVAGLVLGSADGLARRSEDQSDQANRIRIKRVLSWMEENPAENASAEELARIAGLSAAAFHLHFKRETGTSPKDHWRRLKVEHAARRLRTDPHLSVTDVAHDLGFSSSQYFATVFRRYLGVAPGALRDG